MSIYSGFGTRALEGSYMKTLNEINRIMADRLMTLMSGAIEDNNDKNSSFCRYFVKLFKKLYKMDKYKRLEPLYSKDLS